MVLSVTPSLGFSLKLKCQGEVMISLSVSHWIIQVGILKTQVVSKWMGLRDKKGDISVTVDVFTGAAR